LSADGTVRIGLLGPSGDKTKMAISRGEAGSAPVLIRIETRSGRDSSNMTKAIEATADEFSFFLRNVGAKIKN
jgi:hypothetical protein